MEKGIILVAGVSGVGKTTLCRRLATAEPGIHHLVASSFVDGKRDVDQLKLISRIRAAADKLEGACLVDGHLTLDGSNVPLEAIAALAPEGIIVVTGSSAEIAARRGADVTRSRPPANEDELCHTQDAEISWARELALAVSVPFTAIDSQDEDGFRTKVYQLLGMVCPQGESGSLNRYSARLGT
ncbi:ATP-binding protein [Azospirillum argentinense]|nr:ATP-binding protein [Azospirillum argentinense]